MPRTYTFEGKRQQRWMPVHTEQAKKLMAQGMSYQEIGKIYKRTRWTFDHTCRAIFMRHPGWSYRQIARNLGFSPATIRQRLIQYEKGLTR